MEGDEDEELSPPSSAARLVILAARRHFWWAPEAGWIDVGLPSRWELGERGRGVVSSLYCASLMA